MNKNILVFSTLLILSCSNVRDEVPWSKILTEPSEDNFIAVKDRLSKRDKCDAEWYSNAKYSGQLFSLLNMVSEGNEYAFELSILIIDCLDGGDLGDMYRSIGLFFEREPLKFFRIVDDRQVPDSSLKNMLVMLPIDTVDALPKKIVLLEKRLEMTLSVKSKIAPRLYKKVVSILDREIDFLRSLDAK